MPVRALVNGRLKVESVLFATDFSPASYPASLYATALAAHLTSALTIVHVFLPNATARGGPAMQRSSLEELLGLTVDALAPRAGGAKSLLLEGDPAVAILQLANESGNALLLLGTHGGNSVAQKILHQVTIPTLTVGPHVPEVHKALAIRRILYAADCSPLTVQAAALASAFAGSFASRMEVADESQGPVSSQHAQEEILRRLRADQCDLLVLATEPIPAFRLITESPCPVLTIPGACVQ